MTSSLQGSREHIPHEYDHDAIQLHSGPDQTAVSCGAWTLVSAGPDQLISRDKSVHVLQNISGCSQEPCENIAFFSKNFRYLISLMLLKTAFLALLMSHKAWKQR